MDNSKKFLGRGWSFPPTFMHSAGRGEVSMVANEVDTDETE